MLAAWAYVREHPGCPILPVAEAVGPNGSRFYGYRTVHRAISAGLLTAARGPRGWYSLTAEEMTVHPNVPRAPFSNYVQRR
jgi:hypothetical protein